MVSARKKSDMLIKLAALKSDTTGEWIDQRDSQKYGLGDDETEWRFSRM
jgi:hypothetical protein